MLSEDFAKVCGSAQWVSEMLGKRPWPDVDELLAVASTVWWALPESEWQAAFAA